MYNENQMCGWKPVQPDFNCCPKKDEKIYHCFITKCVTEPYYIEQEKNCCE